MIASRDQLPELGVGFVITEGLARCVDTVELDGDRILVYSDTGCDVMGKKTVIGSSGATCIRQAPVWSEPVLSDVPDVLMHKVHAFS